LNVILFCHKKQKRNDVHIYNINEKPIHIYGDYTIMLAIITKTLIST